MTVHVDILPCGEAALRVVFEGATEEDIWDIAHRVAQRVTPVLADGVYGAVPTYDSILVEFDAARQSRRSVVPLLRMLIEETLSLPLAPEASRRFVLPVVYGGTHGPDLGFVAEHLGLAEEDVVALHTAEDRVVRCLGGPAASCMIDGPAFTRPIPRLPDPRLEVPPNAVSVAGRQGVIGPVRSPSGWRLIGVSPVAVMDRGSERLVPYRPGDVVRFRAIAESEWDDYAGVRMGDLAA